MLTPAPDAAFVNSPVCSSRVIRHLLSSVSVRIVELFPVFFCLAGVFVLRLTNPIYTRLRSNWIRSSLDS